MTTITIINVEENTSEIRELTEEEVMKFEKINNEAESLKNELNAKKQNVLDRLGITEEEAKLLLG